MILKSNAFRFEDEYYRQITGLATGKPMAPNYANLFMDHSEQNLLRDYFQKTGLSPLVWFRFMDDIFFIWTRNKDSWDGFKNPGRRNLKLNSKFISPLTKLTSLF